MGPWNKTPEERERIRTSVRAAGQKRRDDFVDRNPNRPSVQQRRMHHHDKHAATKDGHRPDDPHGVTNNPLTNRWKAEQVRFQDIDPDTEPDWKQQQLDDLMTNQIAIQAVLDEPNIRREGHEVFDENVNYDQRVTAFGDIERDLSGIDSSSGSDQLEAEMGRGEGFDDGDDPGFIKDPSNAYARKATFAQDFEGHVGINEYLGMGSPEGNAEGKRRQSEGAVQKARARESYPESWQTDDPDRLSVPASKVLGHDNHQQLMIDASSTGGGKTDSHMIPFVSTPDNIGMLKEGLWRAEGKRNQHTGEMQFSMHPDDPRSNRPPR